MNSNKNVLLRRDKFIAAWREHAPEATFAKMGLAEFEAATEGPDAVMAEMETLRTRMSGLKLQRDQKVNGVKKTLVEVAADVRGNLDYGPDCALYRAFGFVPTSERRSGLTRKEEPEKQEGDADAA